MYDNDDGDRGHTPGGYAGAAGAPLAERPGRAFWLFVLIAVPWVAIVLSGLVEPHMTLTRYTAPAYGAVAGGGAAVALGLLLFRLPPRARLGWALGGGAAAGVASLVWAAAAIVVLLSADCVVGGCE